MHRSPLVLVLVAAIAVGLAACSKVSTETGAPGVGAGNSHTVHGLLRWGGVAEPDTMDPVVGNQQIEIDLSMFWGGYLLNWSDENKFVPELATQEPTTKNGGISADGLAITYHLRPNVKWQDGAPFSADDVIYTYQQVMNNANFVGSRVGYTNIASIEKKDDYTIVVHLKARWAPFVATFFTMSSTAYPILPKHILSKYPNINKADFNRIPVGTGPFKVVEYDKGRLIKMVANQNYWRGAPKIREIDYEIIPDETTILTQLRTGELDFEYNAPSSQAESLASIPGTRVYHTPFTQYRQIAFNLHNPILADLRVRRALAYATNKRDLIAKISHGLYIPADTDQPPFLWAHNANVMKYDYDPAKADALLDSAGWMMGNDGYRHKGGQTLELAMLGTTGAAETRNLEAVVQEQWHAVGVKSDVKNSDSALMFASYGAGGLLQNGKYDTGFYSWINGVDPDDSVNFMCDQTPAQGGQNQYFFCDKRLDAAELVALNEYDPAKRKPAYDTIQSILAEQLPTMFIWYVARQDIANVDLKGYKPAHAVTTFWNTWEWSI
ncbi:MAG TPA: peptide ABC transporter substrate-binding protein [Candidatus Eremiobacteraceae bacterium]|jgi:peptide/nickel transport system substrate-binding protein